MQRVAELDFHDVLADACTNLVLALQCRLLNELLKNLPICRAIFAQPTTDLAERGQTYHTKLLAAYRAENPEQVGHLMYEHMCEAEKLMTQYEKATQSRWSWEAN
jgi:DNA-binding FadR family transcriptional regulator